MHNYVIEYITFVKNFIVSDILRRQIYYCVKQIIEAYLIVLFCCQHQCGGRIMLCLRSWVFDFPNYCCCHRDCKHILLHVRISKRITRQVRLPGNMPKLKYHYFLNLYVPNYCCCHIIPKIIQIDTIMYLSP